MQLSQLNILLLSLLLYPLQWRLVNSCYRLNRFQRVDGAPDCVRPDFYRILTNICSVEQCALSCYKLLNCQAFSLLSACQCKLFLFNSCSHRVQSVQDGCGIRSTVYVRRISGAAPGSLCPPGYSRSWFGTAYKLIDTQSYNWSAAKAACSSEGGLAKFADALDANETQWLRSIRTAGMNYYIGGFQTKANASDLKANWMWDASNATVDRNIWQPGNPSSGTPIQGCILLYKNYAKGIDDVNCYARFEFSCECNSVF